MSNSEGDASDGNGDVSGDDDVCGDGDDNVSVGDAVSSGDLDVDLMNDHDNLPERVGKNRNAFLLPVLAEDEEWELCPTKMRINLTSDHSSSAAENGVQAAFGPQYVIFRADCTFHAGPAYWSKTHGGLFTSRVAAEQKQKVKLMNSDFEVLKNCPFPELAPLGVEDEGGPENAPINQSGSGASSIGAATGAATIGTGDCAPSAMRHLQCGITAYRY